MLNADVHGSPFDVGVRTTIDDFACGEVMSLNERHGSLIESPAGVNRLMNLVGGHPYLLQCAFEALKRGTSLDSLERDAEGGAGTFGEQVRRLRRPHRAAGPT